MEELVAQHVEAVGQDHEHGEGVLLRERAVGGEAAAPEVPAPRVLVEAAGLVLPETVEHKLVVQQQPGGARVGRPDERVDQPVPVGVDDALQEFLEEPPLRVGAAVRDFVGIGRVEGDSQEDEAGVRVLLLGLGALQPAERPVRAHGQRPGKARGVTHRAMLGFEGRVVEAHHRHLRDRPA